MRGTEWGAQVWGGAWSGEIGVRDLAREHRVGSTAVGRGVEWGDRGEGPGQGARSWVYEQGRVRGHSAGSTDHGVGVVRDLRPRLVPQQVRGDKAVAVGAP